MLRIRKFKFQSYGEIESNIRFEFTGGKLIEN